MINQKVKIYTIHSQKKNKSSGLEMTHFFNNKQVLMENVSFQDLTPKLTKKTS